MFDWRRKRKTPPANSNRVDELANGLARQGRTAEIEFELDALDRTKLSECELESWYHVRGIAAFRRGDRPLAMARFIEAHAAFPESATIAFSLGQEYEYLGDIASTFELFDRAVFPKLPASHALAQSRYAYLWGDLQRAVSYVEPVLEMHYKLGIADDMFLYIRGMPFFSQTWAYMAAFAEIQGDLARLDKVTRTAVSRLKECDLSHLVEFLACIKTRDFSRYAASLQSGTGYARSRAAVIRALREESYQRAQDVLSSVRLADNDFPWLPDMLLLANCEAAHRCEPSAEPGLVERFFLRQPLLFEPDHAVNFRVLDYQESLKRIYQSRRRAATTERS